MKYNISEFAKLAGVTADTLRLYEKHGIIKPMKDNKNNYRCYDDLDVRNLLISRWYRSLQIPLNDVAALVEEASLQKIIEKIKASQANLEEDIKKSSMLLNKIVNINNDLYKIESMLNKCTERRLPGIYRLKQTNKNSLLKEDYLKDMSSVWMNMLPFSVYSFRIGSREFLSEEGCFEYSWGLAIYEDEIHNFNIEINDNVEYISSKVYITSVILSPYEEYITRDSLQFIIDYMREKNYSIAGDIIGRILFIEKIDGKNRSYLEVNIPMEAHK